MQVIVQGRNVQVTDRLQEYVEGKVNKLDRYLSTITEARMELTTESTKSAEDRHVAQLTVRSKGGLLRAEERSKDIFMAVDMVMDKMRRQIDRYKKKRWGRTRGVPAEAEEALLVEELEEEEEEEEATGTEADAFEGRIVRVKRFEVTPMDPEEAVEQMELLGHSFFVFYNVEEGQVNVVYARRDGNYGLIQPQMD